MNKLAIYLNKQISGNVFDKKSILEAYSTDRSILKIVPKFVAFPEKTEDVQKILSFFNQLAIKNFKLPIGVWGSGFDTTGADLTSGLLISTERMNEIKEIDPHDRLVHVESGVTLGQLNSALSTHGLILPINADPRETIGGLISNCPTDSYAAHFGGIMNYIERAEVVLSDGSIIQTSSMNKNSLSKRKSQDNLEGSIYREIETLLKENSDLMGKFSETQNLAGYPSIFRCQEDQKTFDILPMFYGAQGTLGVITEIILHVEPLPRYPKHLVLSFGSFKSAEECMQFLKPLNPLELAFYDSTIFNVAEKSGKKPTIFAKKLPDEGYTVHAVFNANRNSKKKIEECLNALPKNAAIFVSNPNESTEFHELTNSLLSYLNTDSEKEYTPIINDIFIPSSELGNFIHNLKFLEEKHNTKFNIYGSYATNIYSVRPEINITTDEGRLFVIELLRDFNTLLNIHHGHLAGGTPEGRLKALLTNHEHADEEKRIFKTIKSIFDPNHILSPDIKLNADPRTTSHHFRSSINQNIQF